MINRDYVLVTPARNEEANIEKTIRSVVSQSAQPRRWVIVSDGSTDRTDEILDDYASRHDFIQLIRSGGGRERNFGSKVAAFTAGYTELKKLGFRFVGNLDADVGFQSDYYERILKHFDEDPRLGIAGGVILELIGDRFVPQHISSNSVAGAVQLFRRECYESIGGYIPLKLGGIDAAAEIMARKQGWTVQTFTELPVRHYRRVATGRKGVLGARFCQGVSNYLLGYHPLFQLLSCVGRVKDRPFVIGSAFMLLGYSWAGLRRCNQALPDEVIQFLRSEQLRRISIGLRERPHVWNLRPIQFRRR